MKRNTFIFIFLVLSIGAVVILLGFYFLSINANVIKNVKSSDGDVNAVRQFVLIDKTNFQGYLERNEIITNLPKNAVISLKIDSDYYTVKKASIENGKADNPDLEVSIPGNYISGIGDFCNTVRSAINNGDAVFDLKIGRASFLWKYRAVVKYKDCFWS
ncbi:MAG: hypothetical protein ABH840_04660 [Nanoarchaeota archaeon]